MDGNRRPKMIGYPTESAFIGEAGEGSRKNTLYLIDDAQVSQSLSTSVLPNTEYRLQFDVGECSNVEIYLCLQNLFSNRNKKTSLRWFFCNQ